MRTGRLVEEAADLRREFVENRLRQFLGREPGRGVVIDMGVIALDIGVVGSLIWSVLDRISI
jgi:hypothetical protein